MERKKEDSRLTISHVTSRAEAMVNIEVADSLGGWVVGKESLEPLALLVVFSWVTSGWEKEDWLLGGSEEVKWVLLPSNLLKVDRWMWNNTTDELVGEVRGEGFGDDPTTPVREREKK